MWQPFGKVCGVSTVALVSRRYRPSASCACASSNSPTRRSVPTTSKCPARYAMSAVGRFQQCCRERLCLLQHQVDRAIQRAADRHGRARADRRVALDAEVRVSVAMPDLRRRYAELRADDARIDRRVALAGVPHADPEQRASCRRTVQRGVLRSASRPHVPGNTRCRCRAACRACRASALALLEVVVVAQASSALSRTAAKSPESKVVPTAVL